MKKYIVLLTYILLFSVNTYAQNDFSVLSKSGDVQIKKKPSKTWQPIKTGDKVSEKDEIRIFRSSYLGMVHSSGKTIEITAPGTYSVSQLAKKVTSRKSNLTLRLTQFVTDEITSQSNIIGSGDYHQDMKTVGAAERATEGSINYSDRISGVTGYDKTTSTGISLLAQLMASNKNTKINTCFPGNSYLVDDDITFSWSAAKEVPFYEFKITDKSDSLLFSAKLYDTILHFDISKTTLRRGHNYYWSVTAGDKKSDEYCIQWLPDDEAKAVNDSVSLISKDFGNNDSPLQNLTLAAFYEDRNIMNRAVDSYLTALEKSPGNKDFQTLCSRYLRRIGMGARADMIQLYGR